MFHGIRASSTPCVDSNQSEQKSITLKPMIPYSKIKTKLKIGNGSEEGKLMS